VVAHNLIALLSAVVADVNHGRLHEQLEQSPEPPRRPAAARVAAHNTKLLRRWLLADVVVGRVGLVIVGPRRGRELPLQPSAVDGTPAIQLWPTAPGILNSTRLVG
jgi:hypothetical protein